MTRWRGPAGVVLDVVLVVAVLVLGYAVVASKAGHDDAAGDTGPAVQVAATTAAPSASGEVTGADQSLLFPVGACLAETAAEVRGTVPCERPHDAVAVGRITLPTGPSNEPPTGEQFDALAAPRCMDLAKSFFGPDFHDSPTLATNWLRISPESWRAGSRSFTCTVGYRTETGGQRSVAGAPPHPTA
ncbi:septum formation family protein [Pseudofrankia saprophytica]|uniref:septum formation family protein n=1 Tax=Pseudofrankia saprophytica TaxID=298655 RepID=UPI000234D722|nr:septum formation family protein [Pseudofrankia saprophytica]